MKDQIRSRFREKRQQLNNEECLRLSAIISNKLLGMEVLKKPHTVACYIAKPEEVQTEQIIISLLNNGKKIVVPKVNRVENRLDFFCINSLADDLEEGYMGIKEPKKGLEMVKFASLIDFAILPSVVLDKSGKRIGFGGGYYDRFFSARKESILLCAIAFDFQVTEDLPGASHDVNVDIIVTDKRIINCRKKEKLTN